MRCSSACYLRDFPVVARTLRDHFEGSYEALPGARPATAITSTGTASASRSRCTATRAPTRPTPTGRARPLLPFEIATGRLIDDVWERWLELDPVRMAPRHADALRSMRRIYLDAGRATSTSSTSARRRSPTSSTQLGVEHTLELFDGEHGGIVLPLPGRDPRAGRRARPVTRHPRRNDHDHDRR